MSLIATLSQEFRASAPEFDANEFRPMNAGALNLFQRQSRGVGSFVTDELREKAYMSTGNTLKIPAINYKDVAIRTTRPLIIADDENTSVFYTVTFATFAAGFTMYPAQHFNNDIGYQQDFNKKYLALITAMKAAIEGVAEGAINLGKTQVIEEVTGDHAFANNVVSETAQTLKDSYVLADLEPMMSSNDYPDMGLDILGNQGFRAIMNRMDGFGVYNEEAKTIMFNNKGFSFTNAIQNATDKKATGYAVAPGQLGMMHRVEPDSIYRTELPDGHVWGEVVMPGLEIPFGTYQYKQAVDASGLNAGTGHLTRTSKEAMDFAVDIAFVTKYNSDRATIPSGIIKFDIALPTV